MRPPHAQETPLPWNDTSKPGQKPGPWDPPANEGDTSGDGRSKGGGRAVLPAKGASSRGRPSTSRGGDEPAHKPRPKAEPRKAAELFARGPHLDDLGRELRARFAAAVVRPSGHGVRIEVLGAIVGALVAAWACSGVYEVEAGQTAVVTRFGIAAGQVGPGVHYHLPAPIESVRRLSTAGVNRLQIGLLEPGAGPAAARQMLTRDGKLVGVNATLQWRITDPLRYVSRTADQEASLRTAAEAAISEAVGQAPLADVLGPARPRLGVQAAMLLRRTLAREDAGVEVVGVLMGDVRPPEGADAGFHAIADANVEAQAGLNGAEAYHGRVVAEARGDAAKMVQASQGYRDQEVSEAKGEAERFALVDAQYKKAPEVTRERLYTETMERVLHNVRKVVVQAPRDGGQIVLPAEAFHGKAPEAAQGQAVQAQPAQGAQAQGAQAQGAQAQGAQSGGDGSAAQPPQGQADQPRGSAPTANAQAGGGVA